MAVTTELLSTFPVLGLLPRPVLAELAQESEMRKYARRGVVLSAGLREERVCFLFEGRLQGVDFTIDGREVGLYFVEPGDYCGELALFDQGTQPEFVIALTAAVVVSVPAENLRAVMQRHAAIANSLSGKLAARVRQLTLQRSLLGLPNVGQRVCCQLWLLVPENAKHTMGGAAINNPPTHMEIANMLNLSRETVTRIFQTLQNRQIVRRSGSTILLVNDLNALKELAEGKQEW